MSAREPLPPPLPLRPVPSTLLGEVYRYKGSAVRNRRIEVDVDQATEQGEKSPELSVDRAKLTSAELLSRLSPRELQVFVMIAEGVNPSSIAKRLGLSVKTVSTYRARILEKTRMGSNAEIAAYACQHGLSKWSRP